MKKMKILFVDDEESILHTMKRILHEKRDEWDLYFSTNVTDAIKLCEDIPFDLVVTDSTMSKISGAEFLKLLQKNELTKYIPTIMLTGKNDSSIRKEALKLGVIEFLLKPIIPEEFILRLENVLKLKKLNDELIEKNKTLEKLSSKDALTGLYNRRYLMEFLETLLSLYKRYHRPFSIIMFDIDNFKSFNDRFGHSVGDELLIKIAHVLNNSLRKTDTVCRYGGDEFLIVLPETSIKSCGNFINRIINNIHEIRIMDLNVCISGGAAEYKGEDVNNFIKSVDELLYQAKKDGKNKIIYSLE